MAKKDETVEINADKFAEGFAAVDKNGDGKISFEELFNTALASAQTAGQVKTEWNNIVATEVAINLTWINNHFLADHAFKSIFLLYL